MFAFKYHGGLRGACTAQQSRRRSPDRATTSTGSTSERRHDALDREALRRRLLRSSDPSDPTPETPTASVGLRCGWCHVSCTHSRPPDTTPHDPSDNASTRSACLVAVNSELRHVQESLGTPLHFGRQPDPRRDWVLKVPEPRAIGGHQPGSRLVQQRWAAPTMPGCMASTTCRCSPTASHGQCSRCLAGRDPAGSRWQEAGTAILRPWRKRPAAPPISQCSRPTGATPPNCTWTAVDRREAKRLPARGACRITHGQQWGRSIVQRSVDHVTIDIPSPTPAPVRQRQLRLLLENESRPQTDRMTAPPGRPASSATR